MRTLSHGSKTTSQPAEGIADNAQNKGKEQEQQEEELTTNPGHKSYHNLMYR